MKNSKIKNSLHVSDYKEKCFHITTSNMLYSQEMMCMCKWYTDKNKIFVRVALEKIRNIPSARTSITSIVATSFLSIYFIIHLPAKDATLQVPTTHASDYVYNFSSFSSYSSSFFYFVAIAINK